MKDDINNNSSKEVEDILKHRWYYSISTIDDFGFMKGFVKGHVQNFKPLNDDEDDNDRETKDGIWWLV